MRLLLDSHALIWYVDQDHLLVPAAHAAITDPSNDLLLSAATIWEVPIKVGLGKLSLSLPFRVTGRIKCSHLWAECSQPGLMQIHNPQNPYDSQADPLFVSAVFRRGGVADAGLDPVGGMAAFASGSVVGLVSSETPEFWPAPSPISPVDRFRKR